MTIEQREAYERFIELLAALVVSKEGDSDVIQNWTLESAESAQTPC